jgi:hypothetical protein
MAAAAASSSLLFRTRVRVRSARLSGPVMITPPSPPRTLILTPSPPASPVAAGPSSPPAAPESKYDNDSVEAQAQTRYRMACAAINYANQAGESCCYQVVRGEQLVVARVVELLERGDGKKNCMGVTVQYAWDRLFGGARLFIRWH